MSTTTECSDLEYIHAYLTVALGGDGRESTRKMFDDLLAQRNAALYGERISETEILYEGQRYYIAPPKGRL